MNRLLLLVALMLMSSRMLGAAESAVPAKPVLKITPGQVIVPTDRMRRNWGELISVDLATRAGKFRSESTNEVLGFTVMPYAELLHHAANGDLQDFRVGERAIFRLHENEAGQWVWLTYIQDEMNFLNNHKEYYHVDRIDAEKKQLECTDANADKSYVREGGLLIEADPDTRFWKNGQAAAFADIKLGDKLRTKTHGVGQGKRRVAWEVFLDDESLLKFQAEQKVVHAKRMTEEGLPCYVDTIDDGQLQLTVLPEAGEPARALKPKMAVRVSPAGVDRKPIAAAQPATVVTAKVEGRVCKVTLSVTSPLARYQPAGLARLWIGEK